MRQSPLTRREFLRLAGLGLGATALAACAGPAPSSGAQPTAAPAAIVSAELRASDVALLSATGRPQLVEFFAFW
jgi:hypothetical protein